MHPFKKMIFSLSKFLMPLTQYCYEGIWESTDTLHPEGGTVNYKDANGVAKSMTGIFIGQGVVSVYSSVTPTTNGVSPTACPI